MSTSSYVESYQACEGSLRQNYRDFDAETMALSRAGPYHGLWWTDTLDPAHRRDPDTMGGAAMCGVGGVRPPQPERFHYNGTSFLG